jgi:16S rRNA U516 pseudouridylate synthase RsuA-like enzyme
MIDGTDDDSTPNITLKSAVQLCWPNETPLDVVRMIKQGCIEVSSSSPSPKQPTLLSDNTTTISSIVVPRHEWKVVRQYGKRIVRPSHSIRRKYLDPFHQDESRYEIRIVPTYPIVVAMYKPCGYIVTTKDSIYCRTSLTDKTKDNDTCIGLKDEKNCDHTMPSLSLSSTSSSSSVYDLLHQSIRRDGDGISFQHVIPYLSQLRAVGRLDKNTEGLLLFTNHGRWNIALTTPLSMSTASSLKIPLNMDCSSTTSNLSCITIWKQYRCILQNSATEYDLQYWIRGGIPFRHQASINGIAYSLPALSACFVEPSTLVSQATAGTNIKYRHGTVVDVTIGEGKYRQIRRCWESLSNNKVLQLRRISFGPIELDEQSQYPGQCRILSTSELHTLEQYVETWYRNNPNYTTT